MKKGGQNLGRLGDEDLQKLVDRLRLRKYDESECFICARSLETIDSSAEHVIPRWVQRRYDLWDQKITLINGTTFPYRKLVVPCCDECNKYRLQPIEISISAASSRGPEAVRKLGRKIIFLWLGKIFYALLYKELFLLTDQSKQQCGKITTPNLLEKYNSHLFLLQAAREKIDFVDFCPGSIFVFRTQRPSNPRYQWDFCDNIDTMLIAIRMGDVGLIGVLGDGGAQQGYEQGYRKIMDFPLHPLQFRELCAHFSYRATTATRTPKYITLQDNPHKTIQLPLGGWSLEPLFRDWEPSIYAKHLSFYTGFPYEMVFKQPDRVINWLENEDGKIQYIDVEQHPYFPNV